MRNNKTIKRTHTYTILVLAAVLGIVTPGFAAEKGTAMDNTISIKGITGTITSIKTAIPADQQITLSSKPKTQDIDLKRMAEWAMNYLVNTPRKSLGYEPVFQCHPLRCPPVPEGQDPVVSCDTDARMDWEWYYMREISGSDKGRDVEAAFHKRIRGYVGDDGIVLSAPGAYREGDINAKYTKEDYIIHIWGATKILKSLSEDYIRTKDPKSKETAQKVMLGLKKLATWDEEGRCYFRCGMGALKYDGSVVPNGWNVQPAPIVEPLVTYYMATGDPEGLKFAKAYADGMMDNIQPDGIRFNHDGTASGGFPFGPHSHATMHAVWGVAHLGVVTGERKYTEFAKGLFNWLLSRGTGTGWFPAGPDSCNETCCISDMMSIASLLGQAGYSEYYDCVERYMRNYISSLQFIVTPDFETYYRSLNKDAGEEQISKGLESLRKFQGGIIGGSGLNDYENVLLGNVCGFEMFGCCAPEGMRAIYTTWSNVIDHREASASSPAGVYVNMSFSRSSKWGDVRSYMPDDGRLSVEAKINDTFFIRPPHWAPKDEVRAFVGDRQVPVQWMSDYVRFDAQREDVLTITYPVISFTQQVDGLWKGCKPDLKMTFNWLGNIVTSSDPAGGHTTLFTGKPRVLPKP